MSYCNAAFADEYFSRKAFASAWSGADKEKYLETATDHIRNFCTFEDDCGAAFSYGDAERAVDPLPEWLKRATCEQALHLLNLGKDPTQNDRKTTLGIAAADGASFDKSFRADVLGLSCRRILENNGGVLASSASADSRRIHSARILK